MQRFATCFHDHRDPEQTEHRLLELLRQRVYALALGYEDLNDHDRLRLDPLLASLCGKQDPLGQDRARAQDQGKALAGKSTLNRLELTPPQASAASCYKKIVADPLALEDYFIDEWVRALAPEARQVILDLDRTDAPLYGEQEGRFFHGYDDEYCYTPLYIFAGDWPVVAALHTGQSEHLAEILRLLAQLVERVRRRRPQVRLVVRGDSGFCRHELMRWCEQHGVKYVLGLARNAVLERIVRGSLRTAKSMVTFNSSQTERVYQDFRYRAQTWGPAKRRVVGKAEWTQEGANPRFVITNFTPEEYGAQALYEQGYCARGNMENRIKEQKLDLFADRASTGTLRANQLRLWLSTVAYLLVNQLRRVGLGDETGPSALRDDPAALVQDRGGRARDRAAGMGELEQCLPIAGPLRARCSTLARGDVVGGGAAERRGPPTFRRKCRQKWPKHGGFRVSHHPFAEGLARKSEMIP